MLKLNTRMLELLRQSLESERPDLLWVIEINELVDLNIDLVNELREAVGNEFTKHGLQQNYEPNKLGLELEDLIDQLWRLYEP